VHPVHGHEAADQATTSAQDDPVHDRVHDASTRHCARDDLVHSEEQNRSSENDALDAHAETHSRYNSEQREYPTDGGMFAQQSLPVDDEARYCGCGNQLLTVDAINSRKCKPCRDKPRAGYES
jgi:hypothetical protein